MIKEDPTSSNIIRSRLCLILWTSVLARKGCSTAVSLECGLAIVECNGHLNCFGNRMITPFNETAHPVPRALKFTLLGHARLSQPKKPHGLHILLASSHIILNPLHSLPS